MFKKFLLILTVALIPLSSTIAVGNLKDAGKNLKPAADTAGYQEGDIGNITGQIINTALQLVGIIFLALTVYAGYLWMTAQGEESQIEKAKKILTSSIIGLVITMSAYAITALVTAKFNSPNNVPGGAAGQVGGADACNACMAPCLEMADNAASNACQQACNQGACRQ